MEVKLDVSPSPLSKLPRKMRKEYEAKYKSALYRVAQVGINVILDRTLRGVGYKGAFAPYTKEYAAFRTEKNRGLLPNLKFTGKMQGSITSRADSRKAEIFFTEKEHGKKAAMLDKKRPWFGFNDKEVGRLAKVFERYINER
jgi:hypothetical protein